MAAPGESPLWSILVATMVHREGKFLGLLGSLLPQAEASPAAIEVVGLQNHGQDFLSSFRERLLLEARGKYLCFVDDDDWLPPYYVDEIVTTLVREQPDVIGFQQECTGLAAPLTILSLRNQVLSWDPVDGCYLRRFSHVQPVLASIAQQGSFTRIGAGWTGEDISYVESVLPLLHERGSREAYIDKVLYRYQWSSSDTTQSGPLPRALVIRHSGHRPPPVQSPCFRWAL